MSSVARIVKLETGFVSYVRYTACKTSVCTPSKDQKVAIGVWLEARGRRYPAILRWTRSFDEVGGWPEPQVTIFDNGLHYSSHSSRLSVADMAALMAALPRLPVIDYIRHDQLDDWLVKAAGGQAESP